MKKYILPIALVLSAVLITGGIITMQYMKQSSIESEKQMQINIEEESIFIPKTDKSIGSFEQIGNLYRNNKYNFRIKFPDGWNQELGDGLHVLQKAIDDKGNSINIGAIEFPVELKGMKIQEIVSEEDSFNDIKEKFPEAIFIESGFTKIDNKDAFFLEYIVSYEALDVKVIAYTKQWMIVYNDILYTITIGASKDDYNLLQEKFILSIGSFVFEN